MTCCVYSFDGMCPCMDDERWRCGAKIWFKELVLTTLLQHTMIGCEDNVATNRGVATAGVCHTPQKL